MPVDRTRLTSRMLDRKRARTYGTQSIKILSGARVPYIQLATFPDGWFLEHIDDTPQDADHWKLFIVDSDGSRNSVLSKSNAFALSTYVYRRLSADPPKGVVTQWVFRVQPTGERI